jgi:hypothetical protein
MQQHDAGMARVGSESRGDVLGITPRVCDGKRDAGSSVQSEKRSLLRDLWHWEGTRMLPSFCLYEPGQGTPGG